MHIKTHHNAKYSQLFKTRIIIVVIPIMIGMIFILYGLGVIWNQSFHAIDGKRYFCIADDGLITLRYGWNFAHGKGLAWNQGERIEGITNTLWALQSAGFSFFLNKRFLPLATQLSAIGWLLLTAYCFLKMAGTCLTERKEKLSIAVIVALAFILPLSYSPLVVWGLRGMETSLQAALIAATVLLFIRARQRPAIYGSIMLGLACATRPDCIVPSAVIFGFRFWGVITREHKWKHFAAELTPFVCILIALATFRMLYYGSPVPNTYILKVEGMSLYERINLNGIGYILPFITMTLPLIIAVAISLILRPSKDKLMLAALPASMLAYTVYIGGDAFSDWRFMAPYVPYAFFVLLMDAPAVSDILHKYLGNRAYGSPVRYALLGCLCLALFTISRPPILMSYIGSFCEPQKDNTNAINTAIWLNKNLEPAASIGVFYAGSIPYYTDFYAFDFLGKSDRHIASLEPDKSGAVSWGGT